MKSLDNVPMLFFSPSSLCPFEIGRINVIEKSPTESHPPDKVGCLP